MRASEKYGLNVLSSGVPMASFLLYFGFELFSGVIETVCVCVCAQDFHSVVMLEISPLFCFSNRLVSCQVRGDPRRAQQRGAKEATSH